MSLHDKDTRRYHVEPLCRLFGVTKQAYYKYDENQALRRAAQEAFAVSFIKDVRAKAPGMGGLKLWYMYRRAFEGNYPLGRDRFEDMVARNGLKVRKCLRAPRTTDSTHGLRTFPNLVKEYIPDAPNQLWVSDITYLTLWHDEVHYSFCYLSLILDAYSKEIVGWSVGPTLDTTYPLEALRMALKRLEGIDKDAVRLIHHSDRGCQYAGSAYVNLLREHGIRISMTESGDPKDNAQAERIHNTMKNELLKGKRFETLSQVEVAVASAVGFYNDDRTHMSINMMTPHEASLCVGEIAKRWTSYREQRIREKQHVGAIAENGLLHHPLEGSSSGLRPAVNPSNG